MISTARVASVVLLEAPFDPGAFRLRALILFPLPVRHQHLGLEAMLCSLGLRVLIPVGFVGFLFHPQLERAARFLNGTFLESSDPENSMGNDNQKLTNGWGSGLRFTNILLLPRQGDNLEKAPDFTPLWV